MKFWIGFTIGAVVGGYFVSTLDEQQRESLVRRAREAAGSGRTGKIASTISSGVGDVADTATARVTGAVDTATSAVADAIDGNGDATGADSATTV